MQIKPSEAYPDDDDLSVLSSCPPDRELLKTLVAESLGSRLHNVWTHVSVPAEEVFEEDFGALYHILLDSSRLPFLRVVILPQDEWRQDVTINVHKPFARFQPSPNRADTVPSFSLWLEPPIPQHVDGPRPGYYLIELNLSSSDAGELGAIVWRDYRRMVVALCERLDACVSAGAGPLIDKVRNAKTHEDKLTACFAKFPVARSKRALDADETDYSVSIRFAWRFGTDFEFAIDAFRLLYPIFSSILGSGISQRDKMLSYWNRLGEFYKGHLPQLSNYLFAHPVLRKTAI